jgi:predicted GNAT family acetyltransferase
MEFLLNSYPEGCLVTVADGKPVAFITAIRYGRSAWIGNLLVVPQFRCQGIGRDLMQQVLQGLDLSGCETVWLTASADGAHLYQTLGFVQIDRVRRWQGCAAPGHQVEKSIPKERVVMIDSQGWGDERRLIFDNLPENCRCFATDDGFLVHSPCGDGLQIGPWVGVSGESAARMLGTAMGKGGAMVPVCLDVPEKNRHAAELLLSLGFSVSGETLLMYRGGAPDYHAEYIYSLASMGSYG